MPAPANDNFANALNIGSGSSGSQPAITIDLATTEVDEPVGNNIGTLHQTIWYKWTAPADGTYEFDTFGSPSTDPSSRGSDGYLDTTMAIWTGSSLLTLVEEASNDDKLGGSTLTSRCGLTATAGVDYYIQVGTFNAGFIGDVVLNWSLLVVDHIAVNGGPVPWGPNLAQLSDLYLNVGAFDSSNVLIPGVTIHMHVSSAPLGASIPDQSQTNGQFYFPPFNVIGSYVFTFSSPGVPNFTIPLEVLGPVTRYSLGGFIQVFRGGEWVPLTGSGPIHIRESNSWYNPCGGPTTKTLWVFKDGLWQKACGESNPAVNVDKWLLEFYIDNVLVTSGFFYWPSWVPPEASLNMMWWFQSLSFPSRPHDILLNQLYGFIINSNLPPFLDGNRYSPTYNISLNGGPTNTRSFQSTYNTLQGSWQFNSTEIHALTSFQQSQLNFKFSAGITEVTIDFMFEWDANDTGSYSFGIRMGDPINALWPAGYSCQVGSTIGRNLSGTLADMALGQNIPLGDFGTFVVNEVTLGPAYRSQVPNLTWVNTKMHAKYLGQEVRPWINTSDIFALHDALKW